MKVLIIGNGITGVSAAKKIRTLSSHAQITVISSESSQHWSRPALMYIYMGHMRFQDTLPYPDDWWRRKRIDRIFGWVNQIDVEHQKIQVNHEGWLEYDRLLIATGSQPNRFQWPGQNSRRVSGMYSLQDLAALEQWTPELKRAAVVGGGLIGIELAEMLKSRGVHTHLIVRESSYWANVLPKEESEMVNQVIQHEGVELSLSTELSEINADKEGNVCAIKLSSGETIAVDYVGLTAGVHPNTHVCTGSTIRVGRGVRVDATLRTSAPNVFAAGDCAEICRDGVDQAQRGEVVAVWYTGRAMGECVASNMLKESTSTELQPYIPELWFNSAKFFDLEYQVYGEVPSYLDSKDSNTQDISSLFWRHPTENKSVRICHREGRVVGFNVMGVRYRHRVCERWIQEGWTLSQVLPQLSEANFDPEFSRRYEPKLLELAMSQKP